MIRNNYQEQQQHILNYSQANFESGSRKKAGDCGFHKSAELISL